MSLAPKRESLTGLWSSQKQSPIAKPSTSREGLWASKHHPLSEYCTRYLSEILPAQHLPPVHGTLLTAYTYKLNETVRHRTDIANYIYTYTAWGCHTMWSACELDIVDNIHTFHGAIIQSKVPVQYFLYSQIYYIHI